MPLDDRATASPVAWMEWGNDAFARARREDKPILLRISAVWCHWCHVMDDTTDADPEVARRINAHYIPVRVDNDERPDINDRYNLGGWPTTAFLTPAGELITGGTYFSAEMFRSLLDRLHAAWKGERSAVEAEVRERRRVRAGPRPTGGVDGGTITAVVEAALDAYDARHAGFGSQPKFPHPEAVRLLLHAHAGTGAEAPREAAAQTLEAMRNAGLDAGRRFGLWDHVEGGFFRYSTTRDWSEPHFEKMLEDNARLALAYLDGHRLLGNPLHLDTVGRIFDWILASMSDPDGGAYGSIDADGEAQHYGLPLDERRARPQPFVDRRLYTSWNGMLVVGAIEASMALDRPELGRWALRTVDRLDRLLATPAGTMRRVHRPGRPADGGDELLLTDQAWWLQGLLAAFQASGDRAALGRAADLARATESAFFDSAAGLLLDRSPTDDAPGGLAEPHHPGPDNAAAAVAFARLARLGGGQRWIERSESILDRLGAEADRLGIHAAPVALAGAEILAEPIRIHLVGVPGPARAALLRAAFAGYVPARTVEILDPEPDPDRLAELGYPAGDEPRGYVCRGDRCLAPATSPAELADRLAEAAGGRAAPAGAPNRG